MIADVDSAAIPERERVLFAFLRRVNTASFELDRSAIEVVRAAGWSDEAIYDAVSVCALFNFYNRWCDATGVHAMALEQHAAAGRRMAAGGYTGTPRADTGNTDTVR